MTMWLTLTILLNMLSAILLVAVFVLVKKHQALKQDLLRMQKEWIHFKAQISTPSTAQISEPAVTEVKQEIRTRTVFADDWGKSSGGGIREKSAKALKSEPLGESTDRFSRARELIRQGHGMKEVAVVTGLSYSELALLSKTEV